MAFPVKSALKYRNHVILYEITEDVQCLPFVSGKDQGRDCGMGKRRNDLEKAGRTISKLFHQSVFPSGYGKRQHAATMARTPIPETWWSRSPMKSPKGIICCACVGKIRNPNIEIRNNVQISNVSMTKTQPKTSSAITLVVGIGGDLSEIRVFRFEHLNFGF
jgi:hypothetical protein